MTQKVCTMIQIQYMYIESWYSCMNTMTIYMYWLCIVVQSYCVIWLIFMLNVKLLWPFIQENIAELLKCFGVFLSNIFWDEGECHWNTIIKLIFLLLLWTCILYQSLLCTCITEYASKYILFSLLSCKSLYVSVVYMIWLE